MPDQQTRRIEHGGTIHEFPADFTDEDVRKMLAQASAPAGTLPMGSKSPFGQPPGGATGLEIPTGTKTPFPGALEKPRGPSILPMRTEPMPPPPPSARDLRTYGMGVTPDMARANTAHLPMMGGIVGGMMLGGPPGAIAGGIRGAALGGGGGELAREVIEGEEVSPLRIASQAALQAGPTVIARGAARLGKHYTPTPITHDVHVPTRTSAILDASGKPIEHGLDEFRQPITRTITENFSKARVPGIDAGAGFTGRRVIPFLRSAGLQHAPPAVGRAGQGLQNAAPSIDALTREFILSLMMGQGPGGGTPEGR